jgi:hypothetical protein
VRVTGWGLVVAGVEDEVLMRSQGIDGFLKSGCHVGSMK